MWWTWLACADDLPRGRRAPPDDTAVHSARPAHSAAPVPELAVEPPDAVWGRDTLRCAAPDGAPVRWSVDGGEPERLRDGVVPAERVREGRAWTCVAEGYAPVTLEPRIAGGNVLVLLLDDIGRDRLRAFGGVESGAFTPAIDALRDRSVVFERAWAAPVCSASRAALLTGRRPHRTGLGDIVNPADPWALATGEVTLADALQAAAVPYDDLFVGKWHLANRLAGAAHPLAFGFDRFLGSMANLDATFQPRLPPTPLVPIGYFQFEWNVDGELQWIQGYATNRAVEDFRREIAARAAPWFAVVALSAAHKPWHWPPPGWYRTPLAPPWTQSQQIDAMVESADLAVERILAAAGPDVTVILLSDNGTVDEVMLAPYAEGGGGAKGSVQEAGINVPMLIAGPLVRTPGVSSAQVEVADVFDTVLAVAGLTEADVDAAAGPVDRDSISLLPYLADPSLPSLRRVAVSERFKPNGVGAPRELWYRAARDERFKLVRYDHVDAAPYESLYDLGASLVEGEDLLLAPLSPEAAAAHRRLGAALDEGTGVP